MYVRVFVCKYVFFLKSILKKIMFKNLPKIKNFHYTHTHTNIFNSPHIYLHSSFYNEIVLFYLNKKYNLTKIHLSLFCYFKLT